MTAPENPPGFIVYNDALKAASDNGFRIECGVKNGWLRFASTTAKGPIDASAAPRAVASTIALAWTPLPSVGRSREAHHCVNFAKYR